MGAIIKNILLVNNSAKDVTHIKAALANAHFGNDIIVAEDGEEAIDYLYKRGKFTNYESILPAFILLDIKMPPMNGVEVLKTIRPNASFNKVPVIMLTSSPDTRDLHDCYTNSANSFIVKPVNIGNFMTAIKELG